MSNIELFGSDKVKNLVTDTLYGCDDGELYIEDNVSESFLFDDGVLKNTCLLYTSPSPRDDR